MKAFSCSLRRSNSWLRTATILWAAGSFAAGSFAAGNLVADEAEKGKTADAAAGSGPWITSVRWVDDEHLVAAESQGLLLRTGKVVKTTAADVSQLEPIGEEETSIWAVCPVGEGQVLASNYKGEVFLHGKGDPQKFELTARWIRALEKAPGDGQVLAGTEDGKLVVLSLSDRKETKRIDAHPAAIFDIAVNAAGDKIATVAGDGSIKLWSWPSLEAAGSMSHGSEAVWAAAFSADGKELITGGAERRVRLWDVAKSKLVMSIAVTPDWVTSLALIPDSTLVAAGCMNGQVFVVDYAAKLPVDQLDGPGSAIWSVAISPNGKQLAVSTRKHGLGLIAADKWAEAAKKTAERAAAEKPPAP
jgi:WD40 repeat protein